MTIDIQRLGHGDHHRCQTLIPSEFSVVSNPHTGVALTDTGSPSANFNNLIVSNLKSSPPFDIQMASIPAHDQKLFQNRLPQPA
jgi:hypothetical protein